MQRGHRPMAVFLTALALGLVVGVAGRTGPMLVASEAGTVRVESPAPDPVEEKPAPTPTTTTTTAAPATVPVTRPGVTTATVAEQSTETTLPAGTRGAVGPPATAPPPTTTTTLAPPTSSTSTTTTTAPPPPTTTTATPPTTTTTAPAPLSIDEARALLSRYFAEADLDIALRIAQCESGLDPGAYNPAGPGYGGLFQHALSAWETRAAAAGWAGAGVFDPAANTAVAAWMVSRDGWGHWPNC